MFDFVIPLVCLLCTVPFMEITVSLCIANLSC